MSSTDFSVDLVGVSSIAGAGDDGLATFATGEVDDGRERTATPPMSASTGTEKNSTSANMRNLLPFDGRFVGFTREV